MCERFKPVTRQMAAEILGISLTTLDALVASGALPAPKPLRGCRRVYWLPEEFEGHLRLMLGNHGAVDSQPRVGHSTNNAQPVHVTNAPERAGARPKRTTPSTLKSRRSKTLERLNE
jgi:predicted DNA-binding transcriptional regulator AlpA